MASLPDDNLIELLLHLKVRTHTPPHIPRELLQNTTPEQAKATTRSRLEELRVQAFKVCNNFPGTDVA